MNLIRVSKARGLPVAVSTLYKWRHLKRFPGIFVKLGRSLFIDLDALYKEVEAGRLSNVGGRRERD